MLTDHRWICGIHLTTILQEVLKLKNSQDEFENYSFKSYCQNVVGSSDLTKCLSKIACIHIGQNNEEFTFCFSQHTVFHLNLIVIPCTKP